jgi:DNA-binding NarL/FixJ family response regulator
MADPIRILIADDHAMFRAGIKALLESEPLLEVVGEVSSGDEAVDQVRIIKPDIVIMDLSMPGSSGLEATRRIAALHLDTKVSWS